jgi:hypothetical protein
LIRSKGGDYLLGKARGLFDHGGGKQLAIDNPYYQLLADYVAEVTGTNATAATLPSAALEKYSRTFRRASLILTGTIPSEEILAKIDELNEEKFALALQDLLNNQNIKPFLIRGANDQLLTRSINNSLSLSDNFNRFYIEYYKNNTEAAEPAFQEEYARSVMREVGEAPLKLIAHVVLSNQPYSTILTAPYAMVSAKTAEIFQAEVAPMNNDYLPAYDQWQRLSSTKYDFPSDNWNTSRNINLPHSGLLTDLGFLQQFPSTSTNRNRARARWTYQLFLGVDIENSAARNLDSTTLVDPSISAQSEAACQVCHQRLDSVAAAFQHYGDLGIYHEGAYGLDSLPQSYKDSAFYKRGDTWYRTQAPAGFENTVFESQNPIKQLATALINDERFGEGTVKFWWPNLMGEAFAPETLNEQNYAYRQYSAKMLGENFAANNYNFKELLTNMMLSAWFRADTTQLNAYRTQKRLLTPEELTDKTTTITGLTDLRFTNEWNLIYGGIDSYNVTKRQRDISHMMFRVASRHAITNACTIVKQEFIKPLHERNLFRMVELTTSSDVQNPDLAKQMVFLAQRMWGEHYAPNSQRIKEMITLFNQLHQNAQKRLNGKNLDSCVETGGIPDPALDHSITRANISAWRSMLISLMTDYNYLYE